MDSSRFLGQAGRVDARLALASRPGLSFRETSGGRVRVRHAPCARGPRLLLATDGPNVIEHTDSLLRELDGRADVVVFEPPGTGASEPASGFDFTLAAFVRACADVLSAFAPRTLVFPCYLGFIGQQLARERADQVTRLVTPQTPAWLDMGLWADGVDRRRVVRTPFLGQALMTLRRRSIAASWYRASASGPRFREPFLSAANEAFSFGGCFCLASLMQGFERSAPPSREPLAIPVAVPWGAKDRTHRRSTPKNAFPRADVVTFDECGHCPDLEDPRRFVAWLLDWHGDE